MSTPPCNKYKSTLADVTLEVTGSEFMTGDDVSIKVTIKAYELTYGPVIDLTISVDKPFTNSMDWGDHPFMFINLEKMADGPLLSVENIIDDTPAVRAILAELVKIELFKLYTTTDCTHRARLIAALDSFWS